MPICNVKFYVGGREYKTLCNTVKNAESFRIKCTVDEHSVTAEISDKCCFKTIDGIELNGVKTDYYICKDYLNMKDFIYKFKDIFDTFINTALHDGKIEGTVDGLLWTSTQFSHVVSDFNKNEKMVYENFFETVETEQETKETSTETEPEMTTELESSEETTKKMEIAVNMLKCGVPKKLNFNKFAKALIKGVGLEKAKEIRYSVQGTNVFFEYQGEMYKCYTPQSKLYKLSEQRFNLITWRDLKKESDETDDISGSMYTGRSPPVSSPESVIK